MIMGVNGAGTGTASEKLPYISMLTSLMLAVGTYGIAQTMLIPSLPEIQHRLHTTPAGATSAFSVFFVSGAVTCGALGRLGDMFGKRRLMIVQMTLFSIGALICAVGSSLVWLIVGRGVMGSAVGVFPLSYSLLKEKLPPHRVATAIVLIGGLTGLTAAVGQASGGLVTDDLGYQSIFWIGLAGGCLSIVGLMAFVPESELLSPGRIDLGGAALLAVGLGLPLFGVSRVPSWDWGSARTLGCLGGGIVALIFLWFHERRHPDPLIDIRTLMLARVSVTNAATFLIGFGIFGASVIISQFLQVPKSTGYGEGASATKAGLFLVPGLLLMLLAAPAISRISKLYGPKVTLVLGSAVSSTALGSLAAAHNRGFELVLWPTLNYLGIGFVFGAMPLLILEAVPPELSGQSTSVNMILRNAGSSIGIQVAATFVSASVVAGSPRESGFIRAFLIEAGGAVLAMLIGVAIPAARRQPGTEGSNDELTAAAATSTVY